MKILAIGNSFSTDATRYLYEISKADGVPLKVVNLYIGGCPLDSHYKNMNNDSRMYLLEFNGQSTNFYVSIREALQSDRWDYVTMQQASYLSFEYDTYMPYLKALSEYIKFHAPKSKQVFHQTWAYEDGSHRLCKEIGYKSHFDMLSDIKSASKRAMSEAGIDYVIPSGELIESMVSSGITDIFRDTFHLGLGAGRYAVSALWYELITGKSIMDNNFCDFDTEINAKDLITIKKLVGNVCQNANKFS